VFSIIQAAGWPIWPLLIASVIALALIIERFVALQRKKIIPPKILTRPWPWRISARPHRKW
jgi:biopolymer transport protein ExbB